MKTIINFIRSYAFLFHKITAIPFIHPIGLITLLYFRNKNYSWLTSISIIQLAKIVVQSYFVAHLIYFLWLLLQYLIINLWGLDSKYFINAKIAQIKTPKTHIAIYIAILFYLCGLENDTGGIFLFFLFCITVLPAIFVVYLNFFLNFFTDIRSLLSRARNKIASSDKHPK